MSNLSTVLKHLMSQKGLTSSELARKTRIAQPVIHRLMAGDTVNPQILTLKPIADYFNISIDQLLGYISLKNQMPLDNSKLQNINNKLSTIKTIGSILANILPALLNGYQKAVSANLIKEEVPSEIIPLLQLNTSNLIKAAEYIQDLLIVTDEDNRDLS